MAEITFKDLNLDHKTLQAIETAGYQIPTPVQAEVIPPFLKGQDIIALAQTGTGKTASFLLPMIDILSHSRARARMPRAIIMEPTRELALQVAESFNEYARFHKLSKATLIGGESFIEQEKLLEKGVDILIATPGRLLDFFERGKILLNDIKIFIIDEADRMLDMGFIPDIERIASVLPVKRQTALFSATMPEPIRKLVDKFLQSPAQITVSPPSSTAKTIKQYVVRVDEKQKRTALRHLISQHSLDSMIIFCNRKKDVDILDRSMKRHGFSSGALHGDMTQHFRNDTLQAFKNGKITCLIASDVAARGLDIDDLPCVFNFDVPVNPEDYVHRIGRTGRAGKDGLTFMLISPQQEKAYTAIVKVIGHEIEAYSLEGGLPQESSGSQQIKGQKAQKPSPLKTPVSQAAKSSASPTGFGDEIPYFMRF